MMVIIKVLSAVFVQTAAHNTDKVNSEIKL